jgi:hypothetical protein
MRSLHERFGLAGRRYRYEDIVTTATIVAGSDMSDVFERYVSGLELLPLEQLLARVGLIGDYQLYAGQGYVRLDPEATPAARARRRMFLGGS